MTNIPTYSLEKFKGELQKADLLHLLRRCLFGVGHKELAFFTGKKLEDCLAILLKQSPKPQLPEQEDSDVADPLVSKGKVWVNAPYENDLIDNRRYLMLKMWWVGQLINRDYSLTEKMTLFWHTHFVTEMDVVKDSRYSYRYVSMLHTHSLGNLKKLIREGTTNLAMLVYLNGNTNSKAAPNENYGRELLELFTLGKSPEVKYTEGDVRAAARVLSGWRDDKETLKVNFHSTLHDSSDKQFSSFFDNAVIKGKQGEEGEKEIDELIAMIFQRKETAKFVCRNLYRWFVYSKIDENIEQHIIEPLAEIFIANGYEIAPVLRTLLGSEHFFDKAFRGCIVKSPVDFLIGVMQQVALDFPNDISDTRLTWAHFYFYIAGLSMSIGDPPSVAGWPAYYQAPKFHQWWINSSTLGFKSKIINGLTSSEGMACNGPVLKFDLISFVKKFQYPENVDSLVEECVKLLCAVQISDSSKSQLKTLLLSGQKAEHYWTDAWNKFADNPDDSPTRNVIENRLMLFFRSLMNLPEYQMM